MFITVHIPWRPDEAERIHYMAHVEVYIASRFRKEGLRFKITQRRTFVGSDLTVTAVAQGRDAAEDIHTSLMEGA